MIAFFVGEKKLTWSRWSSITNSCTRTGHPYIFMAFYGIPEIFMDDNNQYKYPPKSTKKGTFYPFLVLFDTFRGTQSLKFGKKVAVHVKIWQKFPHLFPQAFCTLFSLNKFLRSAEISAPLLAKLAGKCFEVNFNGFVFAKTFSKNCLNFNKLGISEFLNPIFLPFLVFLLTVWKCCLEAIITKKIYLCLRISTLSKWTPKTSKIFS